jgi:hypothetical protein
MKRLAWLLLLPLASGALFGQPGYSITGTVPSTGTIGVYYSASLSVSPAAQAAWSLYMSSLPPGLSLSPTSGTSGTATISGIPTTAGTYPFTVQAVIGGEIYVPGNFSITIAAPALSVASGSLPDGVVGVSYSQNLTAVGGYGPGTYTFTSALGSSLPPGLQLSSGGVIYGTPTTAGPYYFAVQVISQFGTAPALTATSVLSIYINLPPVTITSSSLPAGTVGVAYSQALAATRGTPPYTWQWTGGSLPGGLTLASSGTISGTPTAAGSFTFQVKVSDSQEASATGSFTIRITAAALVITTSSLPAGTVGTAYTATTLAATGGTPPYTWFASGLPSGLSISSAGVISGTPTAAGSFSVTVQATDSAQVTATKAYSVTVAAAAVPLSITTQAPLAGGEVGVAYTQAFAATGGTPPYTWSASGLPSGLSISSAGIISGTPTASGSFPVTVQATDSAKATATKAFTITVAAALTITTATLPNGAVGTAYTATTLAATGGTPPYTWSASGLPSGLSISSAGVISGTPAVAGSFSVTLKVTDSAQATATQAFTITITAALTITTASPLSGATVGIAYNQALVLAGGAAPFTWSIASGALPAGIALNPGSLNGIPSTPGTFTFTVSVTDGVQTATKSFTLTVGVPPGPSAAITGLPATATPATQPPLGITMPSAYPLAITGTVTLTFAPDAPSPDDGQEVVFTTGGRTASFTVAANSTQAVFPGGTPSVQVGTVSGTITLTLKLTAAGVDITPSPAPSTKVTIAKSAPFIKSATVTRTSGGFNLVVVGYATSREMVSATVGFTAAAGVTLASSSATVSLASVFAPFYQTADPPYGSQFSLTIPFTFSSSTAPLTSVSVQLTNAQGSSNSMSATY